MADDGGTGKINGGATKVVRYLGKTYHIPCWLSASTFVKRLRKGESFEAAAREPTPKSVVGRIAKNQSYYKDHAKRAYLLAMVKKESLQGS